MGTPASHIGMTPRAPRISLYPPKADLEVAFQVIRKAKVPQIPDIVLALKQELARSEPDIRSISDLVAKDIAITGQLLRTINSPAFSARSKVSSVQQAVSMLGVKRLANLVTAEAINRMLQNLDGSVHVIWESIMEKALVTTAIARVVKTVSADEAYLFGIMHDVGCLIFGSTFAGYGPEWILRSDVSPKSLLAHEIDTLGTDHTTVGFLLARHWQLPEQIALAVYHHHDDGNITAEDRKVSTLVAMVKLAHYLVALSHGTHEQSEMLSYLDDAWQELEISEQDWAELYAQAERGDLSTVEM